MLVWFPDGWEYFAKWGKKEETEMGRLISDKWPEIKEAMHYTNKHRNRSKDVRLGIGPGRREYIVRIFYTGRGGNPDFLQQIGYAPTMTVGMDIFALMSDFSPTKKLERFLVGHVYDDHNDNMLSIIGPSELKIINERLRKYFEKIV